MKKNHVLQKYLWVFMVIVFVFGIFSTSEQMINFSRHALEPKGEFLTTASISSENTAFQNDAKVLSIEHIHEIDDFAAHSAVHTAKKNELEMLKGVTLLAVIAALLFFYLCIERYRTFFIETKNQHFWIMYFIHELDGKKNPCFAADNQQNRRFRNGNRNKI